MGFLIEYDGDDTHILDFAVRAVANGRWVCQVTLKGDDRRGSITHVADFVLSDYRDGEVTLTLWDEEHDPETRRPIGDGRPFLHPDGARDVQRVAVHEIAELRIY